MTKRPIRIAHLTTDDHGGVATVVAHLMSTEWAGVTQEAVIAELQYDGYQRLSGRLKSYVSVPERRLTMSRWLAAHGRHYDAFVIHKVSWSFWYSLLERVLRLPPAVHVIHDMELLTYTGGVMATLLHRYFRSARAFVMTVAPVAAQRLQEFYHRPVGCLPQPIPLQEVDRSAETPQIPLRVLYLSRMDDLRKDLGTLLHAAFLLLQGGRSLQLIIGGAGCYEGHWQRLAENLGIAAHARFCGPVTDLAGFLAQGDVFVFSSFFPEGLPMTILEAISYGIPVIMSTTSGNPSLERQGQTFSPRDVDGLAGLLAKFHDKAVANDLADQQAQVSASREWVRENYSPASALDAYLQAIQQAATASASGQSRDALSALPVRTHPAE